MSGAKILIVTASHLSRNPRVVKEATALGAAGHDVTVLSVAAHPRFHQLDRELATGLPFQRVILDYTRPDGAARLRKFLSRGRTRLAREMLRWLRLETPETLGPARPLLRLARSLPADLTIVHTEIPLWAAQPLIRDGRRVAVDMEDWYSEDLMFADRRTRPLQLLRQAERFALNHCVYASTTSGAMAAAMAESYGCRIPLVVRNTFPLQTDPHAARSLANEVPGFVWFSQTIGPGRGLELFFAAWVRTKNPSRISLIGDLRPDYRAHLLERLPAGHRDRVFFLPLVPPNELPVKLAQFDIGLALEPAWPRNRDLTISNKIFQYMNAGLALVATDTAGQSELMRAVPQSGLLIKAHETTENAARLDELMGDREKLRAGQLASRVAAAAEFCWEKDSEVLRTAVQHALTAATPAPAN